VERKILGFSGEGKVDYFDYLIPSENYIQIFCEPTDRG